MGRLIAFFACIAVAFSLFLLATVTPSPRPSSAGAEDFSAQRALADIAPMASVPHPVGSVANAKVRDYLIARMTALGLSPQIQRAESHRTETYEGELYIGGADIENIVGVLPGRDHKLPALLMMAHHDSVPGSPGAADDTAGVASTLEILRAIKAGGAPARDVIVAITDGEEAGLLGAQAFFADNTLASRVGFVINLEARGGGGRTAMFETGADNGGAIDLFARTARSPSSTSLSVFVYKLLPNDTDFTIARSRGLPGLNYAFIGRQFDYHSPSSTVMALDQGAVQHMGDEVLGTAKALAFAPRLPSRTPDKVYADILGLFVVAYPIWGGWLLLASCSLTIGLGLWRAAKAGEFRATDALRGVGATFALLIGCGLGLAVTRQITGVGFGFLEQRPILARFGLFEVAMVLTAIGVLLLVSAAFSGGRTRLAGVWSGLLLAALPIAIGLQIAAPTIAFLVTWPLAIAGSVSALTAAGSVRTLPAWGLGGLLIILITAWLGVLFHSLLQGLDVPEAPALIVWLAALALWPLTWPSIPGRVRFAPGATILIGGLGLALFLRASPPWTPRYPQATEPLFVVNSLSNRAWLADETGMGAWSRAWMNADGERLGLIRLPGLSKPIPAIPTTPISVKDPTITVLRDTNGRVVVHASPAAGASNLRLDLFCDTLLFDSRVNGKPTALAAPGHWTHLRWQAAPEGFTVTFKPVGPGRLSLRWTQYLEHWPAGAKPMPPLPADVMGWDLAGSTVAVGARVVSL